MKKLSFVLLALGLVCFGLYFVMGPNFESVKVTFNSNGGSSTPEQVLKNGEKAVKPTDPTKENSEFVEWQLAGQSYNFDSIVNKNITLDAVWNDIVLHDIKVTLEGNEYTSQVRDGNNIVLDNLNIPTKEGYKIVFYQENGDAFDINSSVTADLTLNAKYEEIKKYKVTFNSNGGSKVNTVTVLEGNTVEEVSSTRDGYILEGWYLNDVKYDFNNPVNSNITLKAKWTEKGKVNVIFMADGKVYKTIPVRESTKVTKPADPTKKGYKFVEWQLDGVKFDFNTKIESETTLEAKFEEVKSYTVKFNTDGGNKIDSVEVEVDAKVKKPTDPIKKGYNFVEWQLNGKAYDFNKAVTADIELKAIWKKEVSYTVKFISDDREIDSQTVVEGKTAESIEISKSGYKFIGWLYENQTFDFSTPITKDITLTAGWSKVESEDEKPNPDIENNNEEDK